MNGTSTNYICEENNRNLIESGVPLMRRNQEPRINFQCWQTNTIRIYWVSLSLFFRVRKFRYNPVFRWRSLNWYQILSLPTPAIVFVSTRLVKFGGRVSDNLTLNISWLKKKRVTQMLLFHTFLLLKIVDFSAKLISMTILAYAICQNQLRIELISSEVSQVLLDFKV